MTTKATRDVLDMKTRAIQEFNLVRGSTAINGTPIGKDDPDEGHFTNLHMDDGFSTNFTVTDTLTANIAQVVDLTVETAEVQNLNVTNITMVGGGSTDGIFANQVKTHAFQIYPLSNVQTILEALEARIKTLENQMANTSTIVNQAMPVGSIILRGDYTVPTGFVVCHGQELNRTTYAALYTAIGTRFGAGNGSTTFNVPDMRGVFARGAAEGNWRDEWTDRPVGSFQDYATARPRTTQAIGVDQNGNRYGPVRGASPVTFARCTRGGEGHTAKHMDGTYSGTEMDIFLPTDGDVETRPRNLALRYLIRAL